MHVECVDVLVAVQQDAIALDAPGRNETVDRLADGEAQRALLTAILGKLK